MRIGISALFISDTPAGGANSLITNLVRGMRHASQRPEKIRLFTNSTAIESDNLVESVTPPSWMSRNRFVQDSLYTTRQIGDLDGIIYGNYFLPPSMSKTKTATIIHDLLQVHYPEYFSKRKILFQRATQSFAMRRSQTIVTVSEFSRDDLLRTFGDRYADKVKVIHNPIDWTRYDPGIVNDSIAKLTSERPYILSVTAQYPHKNLETLIQSFALLRRKRPEYQLILAGQTARHLAGTARSMDVLSLIESFHLDDHVCVTGFVSDTTLGHLYRNCEAFALPSLFEGFGMPAVEALGFGKPVVTTRCSAIPETTMDRAQYVADPKNAEELAGVLLDVVTNPAAFAPTDDEVLALRDRYSAERIAQAYLNLFPSTS